MNLDANQLHFSLRQPLFYFLSYIYEEYRCRGIYWNLEKRLILLYKRVAKNSWTGPYMLLKII